ncbi:MAG TPA: septation protein A [Burkholderiales bacterium]
MKLLFDLFPVALFFIAFKFSDIYVATAVAIAASLAQIGWLKLRRRKVDTMLWVSLAIIVVFGGATLLLRDETFIKWKPTVLYWSFAVALAASQLGFRRNLMRTVLDEQVRMPEFAWSRLNWSWVGFFAFMGAANLYVAFSFSERYCSKVLDAAGRARCVDDVWVNIKTIGGTGMLFAFIVLQAIYLSRYIEEKPKAGDAR